MNTHMDTNTPLCTYRHTVEKGVRSKQSFHPSNMQPAREWKEKCEFSWPRRLSFLGFWLGVCFSPLSPERRENPARTTKASPHMSPCLWGPGRAHCSASAACTKCSMPSRGERWHSGHHQSQRGTGVLSCDGASAVTTSSEVSTSAAAGSRTSSPITAELESTPDFRDTRPVLEGGGSLWKSSILRAVGPSWQA